MALAALPKKSRLPKNSVVCPKSPGDANLRQWRLAPGVQRVCTQSSVYQSTMVFTVVDRSRNQPIGL